MVRGLTDLLADATGKKAKFRIVQRCVIHLRPSSSRARPRQRLTASLEKIFKGESYPL